MGKYFKICLWVQLVISLAMIVTGLVVLYAVFPGIIDKKIEENLMLREGNDAAKRFISSPVPSYLTFYMFNVTNKDDVIDKGDDPKLTEVGPYVFRQMKTKNVTKWDEENGTVAYTEFTKYFFEPGKSRDLSDVVNFINPVPIAIGKAMSAILGGMFVPQMLGKIIDTKTVNELLFEGYSFRDQFSPHTQGFCTSLPELQNCLSGFYSDQNSSTSFEYEVFTGSRGMNSYGTIKNYNKLPYLQYWHGPTCNALSGTDGKMFHPGVEDTEKLDVFSSDICRSLMFKYQKQVTIEDIDALRFVVPKEVFADPNKDFANMCFCNGDPVQNATCPSKAGVIPLSSCKAGKPIAVSSPYFYHGEKEYQDWYDFKPIPDQHETYLDIEPLTGTVIQAAKRLQINIIVEPIKNLPATKHWNTTKLVPAFWLVESGRIDPDSAAEFREKVTTPYRTGKWSLVAVTAVGGVILLIVIVVAFMKMGSKKTKV